MLLPPVLQDPTAKVSVITVYFALECFSRFSFFGRLKMNIGNH